MLQAFFNGLAAMTNFARGLDNVSNNIANMNTPGYRGKDLFFRSINGEADTDYGVSVAGEGLRLQHGDIRQTGNDSDIAINGEGFFVLEDKEGQRYYTRAGQFRLDKDNALIDSATEYKVMALNDAGNLVPFDIKDLSTLKPVATTKVNFFGNLSAADTTHEIKDIVIYDAGGTSHKISLNFTNAGANTWNVKVTDEANVELTAFDIGFGADFTPAAGKNTSTKALMFGATTMNVEFFFGDPGARNATTQDAAGDLSTATGKAADGRGTIGLASFEFTEKGQIALQYVNGDKDTGPSLAIADVGDQTKLRSVTGSIYSATSNSIVTYGNAGSDRFGQVKGGSVELSNVELTQEFADMLIIQRGYQASARVMSVSNEMIEQLYGNNR